ncbi:hypothetical protein L915_01321 [Phytophthora nicotianae]|uniref:Uncharacterized protein n=1 Tax=Phytophthora nicotianae TaxID=4792 RepID=W2JU60_PHYNI|nr:hypothetical protein L915_01321 [Phytophthora nicotianae]ETL49168.1 hypothetical protein L916_01299 [Phytophthora nicotianae]
MENVRHVSPYVGPKARTRALAFECSRPIPSQSSQEMTVLLEFLPESNQLPLELFEQRRKREADKCAERRNMYRTKLKNERQTQKLQLNELFEILYLERQQLERRKLEANDSAYNAWKRVAKQHKE